MNDNWKFLAGLGVGLVLASLIFIGRPQEQNRLTTITAARELGMIFPNEGRLEQKQEPKKLKLVELKPKMTAGEIAQLLSQEGIITDEAAFLEKVETEKLAGKFIAGEYELGEAWPPEQLLKLLTGQEE